jgi:glycosyltransferase involved in cell wall biosynthesis
MSLSVIIPTYKNVIFLDELFLSIENSSYNSEFEVLIGIDNCYETIDYVYKKEFPKNFKFFFFLENQGPYLIKNTLAEICKNNKILFFDSDDVILPNLFEEIDIQLETYDLIKPKYINFEDKNNQREFKSQKNTFGEGVFGIKKDIFLSINGFEGWRVAADSDLMSRLYKMNLKILHTSQILFHRRLHENSLTIFPETNLSSKMRANYFFISKNKAKNILKLDELKTSKYKVVDIEKRELIKSPIELKEDSEITEYEKKKLRHESISIIFSNQPKKDISKEPKKINYDAINNNRAMLYHPNLNSALKKAKLNTLKKKF